jgi:hypothetical protein
MLAVWCLESDLSPAILVHYLVDLLTAGRWDGAVAKAVGVARSSSDIFDVLTGEEYRGGCLSVDVRWFAYSDVIGDYIWAFGVSAWYRGLGDWAEDVPCG